MKIQLVSSIKVPSLFFNASNKKIRGKYFNLKSSLADADIAGNFTIEKSIELLKRLGYESKLYFENT